MADPLLFTMKHFLCAAVGFALILTASARIGETEPEIVARYGKSIGDIPTQSFGKVRGFVQPGFVVGVAFVNGVSDMEMFSKNDQSDMTPAEIDKFMKTNGVGEWKIEATGKPGWRRWRRDGDALVALYDVTRHFLYINSKRFFEAQRDKVGAAK